MSGTVHTEAYKVMLAWLKDARQSASLSQAQLAELIGKPASFVGKYELGERRLDVIELMVIVRALKEPLSKIADAIEPRLPARLK